ncbi:MAG: WbqC family protein [Pseudomonadota bacterium]
MVALMPPRKIGKIVISQSMYFPWVGLLEQVRLADIFVHYDDVQYTRGFFNRVQIKTAHGMKWITVPIRDLHRGQKINEVYIDDRSDWRSQHRDILRQAYVTARFRDEMLALMDRVFEQPATTLADVSKASILVMADYFGLTDGCHFLDSGTLGISGSSSQRLHDIVKTLGGNVYITGHGARNYLDHYLFEKSGIAVQYMDYQYIPYPQLHSEFTPYVTALDLVANRGREGIQVIRSTSIDWRDFADEPH